MWETPSISCIPSADCYYFSMLISHNNRLKTSACNRHIVLATVARVVVKYNKFTKKKKKMSSSLNVAENSGSI